MSGTPDPLVTVADRVIHAGYWFTYSAEYRDLVCEWLTANGINPNTAAIEDIDTFVLDGPVIEWVEYVLHPDGGVRFMDGSPVTMRRHTLQRVPFPDRLRRPW